ncbi:Lrp/AsnC family transcriptional regulator [Candidatus Woesearchaeota archaeon]|nr:Lrp/AsnC family transcriptional regulator [Candidatus Woesearchaeota archaeon]
MQKLTKDKGATIDACDEEILNELTLNAKISLRDLAKKVRVSFVTVMNRIKKMEGLGIIKKYVPLIDYRALGYDTHVIIEVRISKGKLLELERKLASFPSVYAVFDTTGDFDATLLGRFESTRSLDSFVKKIQTLDFVERTNTKLILNTIKEDVPRFRHHM